MPGQNWEQIVTPERVLTSAGTTTSLATTEQDLAQPYPCPADFFEVGTTLKWTLLGTISTVITTPGTITMKLRYGSSSTAGTVLAASGAYAPDPTAASTTGSYFIQYYLVCRSVGVSGTVMCMGQMNLGDYDDASATTIVGNLNMGSIPASAPAVATIDTTVGTNFLRPTVTFSVATAGTTATNQISILESLNKFGP